MALPIVSQAILHNDNLGTRSLREHEIGINHIIETSIGENDIEAHNLLISRCGKDVNELYQNTGAPIELIDIAHAHGKGFLDAVGKA